MKVVAQILAITYLANGYVYWLILEFLVGIATTVVIEYVLRREYPWLRPQPQLGGLLRKKHAEIIRKTKQLFFHRIGGFAFTQSSSIIIYAYASLSLVAAYGNYMLVATGLQMLVSAISTVLMRVSAIWWRRIIRNVPFPFLMNCFLSAFIL